MGSDGNDNDVKNGEGPSRLACLQCRQKHLKCDGKQPVCNRCSASNTQCIFTASRRGYRGPSKRKHPNESILDNFSMSNIESISASGGTHADSQPTPVGTSSMWTPESNFSSSYGGSVAPPSNPSLMESDPFLFGQLLQGYQQPSYDVAPTPPLTAYDEKLFHLYYENFHASHPILPPWPVLRYMQPPRHLLTVIEFIGSHFSNVSRPTLRGKLATELNQATDESASLVQARLLAAIAMHARNEQREAVAVLQTAIDLALEIGLNHESFAITNGHQNTSVEESLRRTWWELHVVDGVLAGLHQESGFRTFSVEATVGLPCEGTYVHPGQNIPMPPKLDQFLDRFFTDDDTPFSSYCYRIEAVRLLGRVLSVAGATAPSAQDEAESAGYALASWVHHLPPHKAEILALHGEVDELLFQAHMIIACATVYLNLPRSNLAAARPAKAELECARRKALDTPTSSTHVHAVNALKAAKELSALASLPVAVHKHTPFFICSCVLSAVVQLSACAVNACKCLEPHRQQIIQCIGLLKTLGTVWPVAFHVLGQVRAVTNEVMKSGFKASSPAREQDRGIDGNRLITETMWEGPGVGFEAGFDLGQHTFSEG